MSMQKIIGKNLHEFLFRIVQHAANVQHATSNMHFTTNSNMRYAILNIQEACNMQHKTCNKQHATNNMHYTTSSNTWHAISNTMKASCWKWKMQWAMSNYMDYATSSRQHETCNKQPRETSYKRHATKPWQGNQFNVPHDINVSLIRGRRILVILRRLSKRLHDCC